MLFGIVLQVSSSLAETYPEQSMGQIEGKIDFYSYPRIGKINEWVADTNMMMYCDKDGWVITLTLTDDHFAKDVVFSRDGDQVDTIPYSVANDALGKLVYYPVASFKYTPISPNVRELVEFDARASHDPDGEIVSYLWDFGDGETTEGSVVAHSYSKPGAYIVKLTVIGYKEAESSIEKTIEINPTQKIQQISITLSQYPEKLPPGEQIDFSWNITQIPISTGEYCFQIVDPSGSVINQQVFSIPTSEVFVAGAKWIAEAPTGGYKATLSFPCTNPRASSTISFEVVDTLLIIQKFNDTNNNLELDQNDLRLSGWEFQVTDPNGTTRSYFTDNKGEITISALLGIYTIKEIKLKPGWESILPTTQVVNTKENQKVIVTFINKYSTQKPPVEVLINKYSLIEKAVLSGYVEAKGLEQSTYYLLSLQGREGLSGNEQLKRFGGISEGEGYLNFKKVKSDDFGDLRASYTLDYLPNGEYYVLLTIKEFDSGNIVTYDFMNFRIDRWWFLDYLGIAVVVMGIITGIIWRWRYGRW